MDQLEAVSVATKVAQIISIGVQRLHRIPVNDLPDLTRIAWQERFNRKNVPVRQAALFDEILVFGQAAYPNSDGEVVQMMLLDNGFFSHYFGLNTEPISADQSLPRNLDTLLVHFLGCLRWSPEIMSIMNYRIDLCLFPTTILLNDEYRWAVENKMEDTQFFNRVFERMLCFNSLTCGFDLVSLEDLREAARAKNPNKKRKEK